VRTTISISDHLLKEAKKASFERNCTLGEVIEEALKISLLAKPKSRQASKPKPFRTFSGNGIQPGVDLHSNASLADLMDS
jgi:hypothetical protein